MALIYHKGCACYDVEKKPTVKPVRDTRYSSRSPFQYVESACAKLPVTERLLPGGAGFCFFLGF